MSCFELSQFSPSKLRPVDKTCCVLFEVFRYSRYLVFCGRAKSSHRADVAIVMEKLWFGDWFILMQLCKNMNAMVFEDLVVDLKDRYL